MIIQCITHELSCVMSRHSDKVHCSHTTFAIHFYMTEVHTHRISFTIILRIWLVSSLLHLVLQKLSLVHRLLLAGVLLGDIGPWYAERQW